MIEASYLRFDGIQIGWKEEGSFLLNSLIHKARPVKLRVVTLLEGLVHETWPVELGVVTLLEGLVKETRPINLFVVT